jgi:F-type H+-transporting ATPase subunit b
MFSTLMPVTLALFAEGGALGEYMPLIARIFNLSLFVGLLIYVLRRPVKSAFQGRRESIRRELTRAQEEKAAALAKLQEVEERLARLDAETSAMREQARREAEAERGRIAAATEEEVRKIREQARREIENAGKAARAELREYAAGQSVSLAEEMLRRSIRPEDDARLVNEYVEDLGGIRR